MATRTVVVERVIRASPERVWEALTDLQGTERVLSGVERIEVLTEGGFAVGTRWRETRRMLGKEATEEMYVTASEPPERFVVEADSQGAHYVTEFALLTMRPGSDDRADDILGRPARRIQGPARQAARRPRRQGREQGDREGPRRCRGRGGKPQRPVT